VSLTNPTYGLQLDADTVFLFKSIAEIGSSPLGGITVVDSAGNYNMSSINATTDFHPPVVNGPLGRAGALNNGQYARSFRRPNGSSAPSMGRIATPADIDQAFNDAIRDAGGFMQQVMLYMDETLPAANDQPVMGGMVSPTSTAHGEDRLAYFQFEPDGRLTIEWESGNTKYTRTTTAVVAVPGKWQVITILWLPNGGGYDLDVYAHTLDGTVTGGHVQGWTAHGVVPNSVSGTTAAYGIGHLTWGTATLPFNGAIAFARILKGIGSMDATAIAAEASELLTTGELASVATTNDLFRIEFNDAPLVIDEGPFGLHGGFALSASTVVRADWSDDPLDNKHIDLVGTGGRARRGSGLRDIIPETCLPNAFNAQFGVSWLRDIFNGAGSNPTYTIQIIGTWQSAAATGQKLFWWYDSGETSGDNELISASLNLNTGNVDWAHEYNSGTNVVISNLTIPNLDHVQDVVLQQTMLYTLRITDNGGTMHCKLSINDKIDVVTWDCNNRPTGGNFGKGLELGWPAYGHWQEAKLSKAVITDQQILDDWARIGAREGAVGGGQTWRMRGYDTTLGSLVYWNATAEDPNGLQYGGPGPLTGVVTMGVPTS
jgi:hypothetical protein